MAKVAVQDLTAGLLDRLHDTILDGRTRNPRYRQHQLQSLHSFLQQNRDELCRAMVEDTNSLTEEIYAEFHFAIETVRLIHESIDFDKCLKQEYSIAKGHNDSQRRVPIGVVLVRPTTHTRLFSIVSVIAAAFAAGNAILLELDNSTPALGGVLQNRLQIFDPDSFATITSRVTDAHLMERCSVVDQTGELGSAIYGLQHPVARQVLAVVDRSANIAAAAKAIVSSRCSFQGTSPYAVDIVLVNEWVKNQLLEELMREVMNLPSNSDVNNASSEVQWSAHPAKKVLLASARQEKFIESHELVEFEFSRSSLASVEKGPKHCIRFVTVTGLVDAMTLALKLKPILALYSFADGRTAKYIGQFIDSDVHFINQIPWYMLVGPCVPNACAAPDFPLRYTPEMMSRSAPQIIAPATKSLSMLGLEHISPASSRADLGKRAVLPLKLITQGSGSFIPFFPKGILVGAVTIVLPTLCALTYATYQAAAFVYTKIV